MNMNLDTSLLILALETLLEQLVDSREYSTDNENKIHRVEEQITLLKKDRL